MLVIGLRSSSAATADGNLDGQEAHVLLALGGSDLPREAPHIGNVGCFESRERFPTHVLKKADSASLIRNRLLKNISCGSAIGKPVVFRGRERAE